MSPSVFCYKQELLEPSQSIVFVFVCVLMQNISDLHPWLSVTFVSLADNFCVLSLSYVLLELVETERDYVRDLGSVVEV